MKVNLWSNIKRRVTRKKVFKPWEEKQIMEEIFSSAWVESLTWVSDSEITKEWFNKIILDNLTNKWKRSSDQKTWYNIWVEKIESLDSIDIDFAKKLIDLLKVSDITRLFKKWKFWNSKDIKLYIYNKYKTEVFLYWANLDLFEELTEMKLKDKDLSDVARVKISAILKQFKGE